MKNTQFYYFCRRYKNILILAAGLSFLAFLTMLIYPSLNIDEEMSIFADKIYTPWIVQGRYGIQFINKIFTINGRMVPILWDIFSIVFWYASGVIIFYTFYGEKEKISGFAMFAFLAFYASVPFVEGESLSFSMMSPQECIGMVCTALAVLFTKYYLKACDKGRRNDKKFLYLAVLFLFFGMTTYQALVTLYVTAFVVYCLQRVLNGKLEILKPIICGAVISIVALILYYIVNKLVVLMSGLSMDYVDSYIGWMDGDSILKTLFMAVANVARVEFAIKIQDVSIYSGYVIRAASVLFILWSIYIFAKTKEEGSRPRILFLTVMTMFAPFSLYIAMGTYKTQGRMLLALPLIGAVAFYQIVTAVGEQRKSLKIIIVCLICYLLFLNVRDLNTINYYNYLRYEHDRQIANQIMFDIKRAGYDYHKKSLVFVGAYKMDFESEASSSTLGAKGSFWSWDDGNIKRMRKFLKTEGYEVKEASRREIRQAVKHTKGMKKWPMEGSSQETKNSIIVYFSAPGKKWYQANTR